MKMVEEKYFKEKIQPVLFHELYHIQIKIVKEKHFDKENSTCFYFMSLMEV